MTRIIIIFSLVFSTHLFSQNHSEKSDEMIDEMCTDFKSTEELNDSLRIERLNEKFIFPYLKQFSDSERENKIDYLHFRFQKRCEEFRKYLQKVDPPKGENWMSLNEKPKIEISDKEIKNFKSINNFYYHEYAGEKTNVKTNKEYWIETFSDGTTSKLFYKWIEKNKFELEFIESTNHTRKNFSKKGDKYIYQIISKENNYYWVLCQIPGQPEIMKFKLFIQN